MVTQIANLLPCAQYQLQQSGHAPCRCGTPTYLGILTPTADGVWEFLPVCQRHIHEAIAEGSLADPAESVPSVERRKGLPCTTGANHALALSVSGLQPPYDAWCWLTTGDMGQ